MIDYLRTAGDWPEGELPVNVIAVRLLVADAVLGDEDPETGEQPVVSPAAYLPGGWYLQAEDAPSEALRDDPSIAAEIRRSDGRVTYLRDDAVLGCRITPQWAGSPGVPLAAVEEPEPSAESVPAVISDRQFAQQVAAEGLITEAEALAWVSAGAIPAALNAIVEALPAEQRFTGQMLLAGATQFERAHPLTDALGAAMGKSPAELDDLWRAAALL